MAGTRAQQRARRARAYAGRMRYFALATLSLLISIVGCASKAAPTPAAPPPNGPSAEMRAFLEAHKSVEDPAKRAEREAMLQQLESDRQEYASAIASANEASARLRELAERRRMQDREDAARARADYERKRAWVATHCQRRRLDVTSPDGPLGLDTFTQAVTFLQCPANAPDEMKAFARANPNP